MDNEISSVKKMKIYTINRMNQDYLKPDEK